MPVIKGIQKTTLIDYPGKIAATVFTAGCNFRCGFCHNTSLVDGEGSALPRIPNEDILSYLRGRTHQLEGVCISGGEPTVHPGLPAFLAQIKAMGYAIKLDTNGSNPEMLRTIIDLKLVDYIAMDLKGPIELYSQITRTEIDQEAIVQSIEMIKQSGVAHEFRMTVVPQFHQDCAMSCGLLLKGAQSFYLQQYNNSTPVLDPQLQDTAAYTALEMNDLAERFRPYVKTKVRGVV
jgi:pyruvate formate lyase activating enzyme